MLYSITLQYSIISLDADVARGRAHARTRASRPSCIDREFKDVAFEEVVFDNNRFDIAVTLIHNI